DDLSNQYKQKTYVCKIKPVGYEHEGVFRLFDASLPNDTKHYIIENLWKYLIYSELALDLYKDISEKSITYLTNTEKEFLRYIHVNDYLYDDFFVRMEKTLEKINQVNA